MIGMNIKDLIGEATEYDKKLALEEKKPKSWCKSVSAFANTFGGALIFGIANEGMVVGLENPEGDAEKISEVIKTSLLNTSARTGFLLVEGTISGSLS
jgi:ATP-dependent DNA helicase RecG